jgi:LysM repeat protein
MEINNRGRWWSTPWRGALILLIVLAQLLLSACSITVGAPPPTPGPNEPTYTPVEQVHFDVTPVPSPTGVPPTATTGPLPPGATAPPAAGGTVKYTIKPGDTLSGIALEYGITVDDIVKANNMTDPNSIQAGDVINIPTKGAAPSTGGPSPTTTKGP